MKVSNAFYKKIQIAYFVFILRRKLYSSNSFFSDSAFTGSFFSVINSAGFSSTGGVSFTSTSPSGFFSGTSIIYRSICKKLFTEENCSNIHHTRQDEDEGQHITDAFGVYSSNCFNSSISCALRAQPFETST